jgi:hypothetical protein
VVFTPISALGVPRTPYRITTKTDSTTSVFTWNQTRTARLIPRRAHLTLAVHTADHPQSTVKIVIAVAPLHVVPPTKYRQGTCCTNQATTHNTAIKNANSALQKITLRTHAQRKKPIKGPQPPEYKGNDCNNRNANNSGLDRRRSSKK